MTAPSNSVPWSVLIVIGEKLFQSMFSQMLVAMNKEIPEPKPYPFYSNSSNKITITPAKKSCINIKIALIGPRSESSPYIPDSRYANASPKVIINPNNFYAPSNSSLSSFELIFTSIIFAPCSNCIIIPLVIIGEIPSSIKVPLFDASITLSQ